jgi:S-adenosylmethionine hydrolase
MGAIITLTTDFGLADGYVAAMKGVILGINPDARLVDISHEIKPQNVAEGAFILGTTCHYFPEGTIHLAVVDPGVGTDRRAIILKTPHAFFVAPDNSLLANVLADISPESAVSGRLGKNLEAVATAVAITNPRYWRSPVSPTFHGRDVFAPVAAWLSLGTPIDEFGERASSIVVPSETLTQRGPDGSLSGRIIHIDRSGNLVTSIRQKDLPKSTISVCIAGRTIRGLHRTYAESEGLIALIGSSGYLEIAVNGGHAREVTGADVGDEVVVTSRTGTRSVRSRVRASV